MKNFQANLDKWGIPLDEKYVTGFGREFSGDWILYIQVWDIMKLAVWDYITLTELPYRNTLKLYGIREFTGRILIPNDV